MTKNKGWRLVWSRTEGRWIQTGAGRVAHVQVSPNITAAEQDALERLIDAAYRAVENGAVKADNEDTGDKPNDA
jgi:DNA-binding protein YbaB